MKLTHLAEVVDEGRDDEHRRARALEPELLSQPSHQSRDLRRMPAQVDARALEQADENVEQLDERGVADLLASPAIRGGRRRLPLARRRRRGSGRLAGRGRYQGRLALALDTRRRRGRRRPVVERDVMAAVHAHVHLRVRLPVEEREGVDVALIGLGDQRPHRGGTREHPFDLARAGRELRLAQRLGVFGICRRDAERKCLGVEHDRADAELLGEALRDHVDDGPRDVGLRKLLGRDEVDLVVRCERLEQLGLADEPHLQDHLFDAIPGSRRARHHRLDRVRPEQPLAHEHVAHHLGLGRRGGHERPRDRTKIRAGKPRRARAVFSVPR